MTDTSNSLQDLGTLTGLIELHQLASQAPLLGLTNGHQLAIQRQQIFQPTAQLFFVITIDHSRIDYHAAL